MRGAIEDVRDHHTAGPWRATNERADDATS